MSNGVLGVILGIAGVIGLISAWVCGVGTMISLVAAILSSLEIITASVSVWVPLKFAAGWVLSVLVTLVSSVLLTGNLGS